MGTATLPTIGSARALAGLVAAVSVFLAAETVLLVVISRLNSPDDEVYLRAQLASPGFYLVEASVLASGALVAVLYRYWARVHRARRPGVLPHPAGHAPPASA